MKALKLLAAGLLALAVAGSASAQTFVKVTGSTAFRAGTVAAIIDSLTTPTGAFVGSNINGANQAIIHGFLKSGPSAGAEVYFQLAWAGSVGGMNATTNGLTQIPGAFTPTTTWLSSANTLSTVSVTVSGGGFVYTFAGGTNLGSPVFDAASRPDVTMSDTFQNTTNFATPVLANAGNNGIVGIIPFVWVKGPDSAAVDAAAPGGYARFTNIDQNGAKNLLAAGAVPLSVFTGNSADQGVDVIISGRNNDSGTRFAAFCESQFGPNGAPIQWVLTNDGTNINNVGTAYAAADGYSSGGTLSKAVNLPPSAGAVATETNGVPFIVVTYVGVADAMNVNQGQNTLSYNGVAAPIEVTPGTLDIFASGLAAKIQQGVYKFWEYEHLYYRNGLATVQQNAANLVTTQIGTDALASGIKNDVSMQVSRANELQPVVSLIR